MSKNFSLIKGFRCFDIGYQCVYGVEGELQTAEENDVDAYFLIRSLEEGGSNKEKDPADDVNGRDN